MGDHWNVVFEFYIKYENVCSNSILLKCVTARYPSTEWSKYSNCTVTSLKYLEGNLEIHFHHHCQACLIRYLIRTRYQYSTRDSMQNQCQTQIFYKLGQTHLTRTKCNLVDPDDLDDLSWFQHCHWPRWSTDLNSNSMICLIWSASGPDVTWFN